MSEARGSFRSTFGAIAASVGSAVGLGNIWKFPQELSENGGAAFLYTYLVCILLIGLPYMLSEFIIGRHTRLSAVGAFKKLTPKGSKWYLIGIISVITSFLILSFYSVIAGWTLHYLYLSIVSFFKEPDSKTIETIYTGFVSGYFKPIFWTFIFIVITAFIVVSGVNRGVERWSKFLIPIMFVLLVCVCAMSVTMPGSSSGLRFLFDFKLSDVTPQVILSAVRQSAFSLSLGMCCMLTYSSYMSRSDSLVKTSLWIITLDAMVAILISVMIFPAVFAVGEQSAIVPGLVFKTLPVIFASMPYGALFTIVLFTLLTIAALTSTMSFMEIIVAYLTGDGKMERKKAVLITSIAALLFGSICSLSITGVKIFELWGTSVYNVSDYLVTNYLLPIGGVGILLFVGWRMKTAIIKQELSSWGKYKLQLINIFIWSVRIVVPSFIIIAHLFELISISQ